MRDESIPPLQGRFAAALMGLGGGKTSGESFPYRYQGRNELGGWNGGNTRKSAAAIQTNVPVLYSIRG
ncbi:MAG: hypothetical protein ACOC6B_07190 [Thermodesulfobacteriota bacterium]